MVSVARPLVTVARGLWVLSEFALGLAVALGPVVLSAIALEAAESAADAGRFGAAAVTLTAGLLSSASLVAVVAAMTALFDGDRSDSVPAFAAMAFAVITALCAPVYVLAGLVFAFQADARVGASLTAAVVVVAAAVVGALSPQARKSVAE